MAKKSKAELEAENKFLRRSRIADTIAPIAISAIRWGVSAAIAYIAYLSIETLAGKTTDADIEVSLLANIFAPDFLHQLPVMVGFGGIFVGFCGIVYGKYQRSLRMKTVERLQGRIKDFELGKDPKRSSSMLTPTGETRPEDT